MGTSGGVTNFTSTSSHKTCARAGRRQRDTAKASSANRLAASALLTAVCRRVCMATLPLAAIAFALLLPFHIFDECEKIAQLIGGHALDADQVRQQWLQRSARQLVQQSFKLPAERLVARHHGLELQRPADALAAHVALGLQPFQQFVD